MCSVCSIKFGILSAESKVPTASRRRFRAAWAYCIFSLAFGRVRLLLLGDTRCNNYIEKGHPSRGNHPPLPLPSFLSVTNDMGIKIRVGQYANGGNFGGNSNLSISYIFDNKQVIYIIRWTPPPFRIHQSPLKCGLLLLDV